MVTYDDLALYSCQEATLQKARQSNTRGFRLSRVLRVTVQKQRLFKYFPLSSRRNIESKHKSQSSNN